MFNYNFIKRLLDIFLSFFLIILFSPIIIFFFIVSSIETNSFGFYFQKRIGRYEKSFYIIKIKTMNNTCGEYKTNVTTLFDKRITFYGKFMRKWKIDELPQLFNIFFGTMSFVGPRPEVKEYVDLLSVNQKLFYTLRPGITSPATIKYINEEKILSTAINPEKYYREVIYPDKVRLNLYYLNNYSFILDTKCLLKTLILLFKN